MSDQKLTVNIKLIGYDGYEDEIKWHVNWSRDAPELLYKELVLKAEKLGLYVDNKIYLFIDDDSA